MSGSSADLLIYLVHSRRFSWIALHLLHGNFSTLARDAGALYSHVLALTLGVHRCCLGLQYGRCGSGKLFNPLPDPGFVPLSTIVAIQFVPLAGDISHHRDFHLAAYGQRPGALICGSSDLVWVAVPPRRRRLAAHFERKPARTRSGVGTGSHEENASNEETELGSGQPERDSGAKRWVRVPTPWLPPAPWPC